MNIWFHLQTRAIRMFALVLAFAGLLAIVYAAGLFAWQCASWFEARRWVSLPARLVVDHSVPRYDAERVSRVMPFIPQLHVSGVPGLATKLLDAFPLVLFPALLGYFAFSAGRSMSARQRQLLAMARQMKRDRLRRAREYRKGDDDRVAPESRIEPW